MPKLGKTNVAGAEPYRLFIRRQKTGGPGNSGAKPLIHIQGLSREEAQRVWDLAQDIWPTANFELRDKTNRRIAVIELHD